MRTLGAREYSAEELALVRRRYPTTPAKIIALALKRPHAAIHSLAHRMRIKRRRR